MKRDEHRSLGRDEIQFIKDLHKYYYNLKVLKVEEVWFRTIKTFLESEYKGADFQEKSIRDAEFRIFKDVDRSQEYIESLCEILFAGVTKELTEQQTLVLILSATNDQREQALKRVLS